MNKSSLVSKVAESAGLSEAAASAAVEGTINAIIGALSSGDSVTIVGFGSFSIKSRAARMGRNPRTGEALHIAASKSPGFKPSSAFKEAINR